MVTFPVEESDSFEYHGATVNLHIRHHKVTASDGYVGYRAIADVYGNNNTDDPAKTFECVADSLDDLEDAVETVIDKAQSEIDAQADVCDSVAAILESAVEKHATAD